MEDHPTYQAGPKPDAAPELDPGPTTDELIAMARAHREGQAYPTPEELLRNLPRMLRALSDFVLSDEADVFHTAYAIAPLVEVIAHVKDTPLNASPPDSAH